MLDLLHDLIVSLGRPDAEIEVLCAYRTPQTNGYLRTHGHGVARHSLHMQAMAIDIRVVGIPTRGCATRHWLYVAEVLGIMPPPILFT